VLLIAVAGTAAFMKWGNDNEVVTDPPPPPPIVPPIKPDLPPIKPDLPPIKPPGATYAKVNLSQVPWLVPGAGYTVFDKGGAAVVNQATIPESGGTIAFFAAMLSEEQFDAGAPYRLKVRYLKDGVADVTILVEGIERDRFATTGKDSGTLTLNADGLTAAVEGWLAPRFVPTIEKDSSEFNAAAPITLADGDPIEAAIRYPSGSGSSTVPSTCKDGKFEFKFEGATGIPEWVMTSSLFTGETSVPLRLPFEEPEAPLSVVEVTADPNQTGVWLQGLILKPSSEGESPLRKRMQEYIPVITHQNQNTRIIKSLDYEVSISGGPLDTLVISKFRAGNAQELALPEFQTGYAIGMNRKTPYEVNNTSKEAATYYALSMPPNELWRCVIFGFDLSLNDGKGGFYATEGILRPNAYDPSSKKIDLTLDFEGKGGIRREAFDWKKIFTSASIQMPVNWEKITDPNTSITSYKFPIAATISNTNGKIYRYESGESDLFLAVKDQKMFINAFRGILTNWVVSLKIPAEGVTPEERQAMINDVSTMGILPDSNKILGRNAFRIEPLDKK
jgi:hypothetical protein